MGKIIVLWFALMFHHSDDTKLLMQKEPTIEQCQLDGQAAYVKVQAAADVGRLDDFHGACTELTQEQYDEVVGQVSGDMSVLDKLGSV